MAVARKRMEWLRSIPFNSTTKDLAYSYPNGGLAATSVDGVSETTQSGGRTYRFWITVFVRDDKVFVVEAGGDHERFTGRAQESVEQAIASVTIG